MSPFDELLDAAAFAALAAYSAGWIEVSRGWALMFGAIAALNVINAIGLWLTQ